MPNAKITDLPSANVPLGPSDLVEVVQGGVNKKALKSSFGLQSVQAGSNVTIDDTDPSNPKINASGGAPPWDDTTPGIVERSTQTESEAIATQVAAGTVGSLSGDRATSEIGLYHLLISFLTKALTWAAKQTFTTAPRFSSTTATQFLKVDADKDVVSIAPATFSDVNAGTDNEKPLTALAMEGSKYNFVSAQTDKTPSGTTQTLDFATGQFVILNTGSATGDITLTLQNPAKGATYRIKVVHGATKRNLIFPSGTIQQGGGGQNYTASANNATDYIYVTFDGTNYNISVAPLWS